MEKGAPDISEEVLPLAALKYLHRQRHRVVTKLSIDIIRAATVFFNAIRIRLARDLPLNEFK